jgi:6-phosphogluconolactonase
MDVFKILSRISLLALGSLLVACSDSASSSSPNTSQNSSTQPMPATAEPADSGSYAIGGVASGLIGTGLMMQLNGDSELPIATNGKFGFAAAIASGAQYKVTVSAQPINPDQTCVVSNASGTVASADITNVVITCTPPPARFAYVGTHTGIYCFAIDPIRGGLVNLDPPQCDSGVLTAVAAEPSGHFLYATNSAANTIRAYQIDSSTGALSHIVGPEASAGNNPVSMAIGPAGRFVYVGNYGSDSVSAYAIGTTNGALSPVQGSPFPTGHLPNSVTIDPSGAFLYTANNGSSDVSAFSINAISGALTPVPGSPFPAGVVAMNVAIDPAGRFAFVANLNSANVSAFTIDRDTGTLVTVSGSPFSTGCSPDFNQVPPVGCSLSGLAVDASGAFLYAVGDSQNTISGYSINPMTGALTLLTDSPFHAPADAYMAAAHGAFLYVSNNGAVGSISTFAINSSSGGLTQLSNSPVPLSNAPEAGAYNIAFAP